MKSDLPSRPFVIQIVDEEPIAVRLFQAILESDGYKTLSAHSGRTALECAIAQLPDLIWVDLMMPDIDGIETVARLKAHTRTRAMPVVVVTAMDDRQVSAPICSKKPVAPDERLRRS